MTKLESGYDYSPIQKFKIYLIKLNTLSETYIEPGEEYIENKKTEFEHQTAMFFYSNLR